MYPQLEPAHGTACPPGNDFTSARAGSNDAHIMHKCPVESVFLRPLASCPDGPTAPEAEPLVAAVTLFPQRWSMSTLAAGISFCSSGTIRTLTTVEWIGLLDRLERGLASLMPRAETPEIRRASSP